jgi:endonuclease/exonuclease/phosphatase family metal-dependent hydrolase
VEQDVVSAPTPTVRLMTWNIHGAVGRNRRFDLARVVELILRHAPDIVALQEIDSRRVGTDGNPFTILQEALGRHGVGAKTITTADGDYGQALFSRWPIQFSDVRDISFPEREPRRAIRGEIATPVGPICVVATHLGLSFGERRSQAAALLELARECAMTTVVLGDFNDWFWAGSVRKVLARALPGRTRHRTFPSVCPLLHLDRIYCRPRGALVRGYTDRSARQISDHLPVIADVKIQQQSAFDK